MRASAKSVGNLIGTQPRRDIGARPRLPNPWDVVVSNHETNRSEDVSHAIAQEILCRLGLQGIGTGRLKVVASVT